MDLASPAVSGTSVYANGLSGKIMSLPSAFWKQMAVKHFVSGMKFNSKMNSLQDVEHQIIYTKFDVLMTGLQYTQCTLLGNEAAWNSTIKMKAIFSTQTFTLIYQTTWRHIPDEHNFYLMFMGPCIVIIF